MAGGAQHRTPSTESPSPSFDDDSHGERQGLQNLDFGAHTSVRPKLYISHGLSAWNSRSFEFGAVLFLSAMYPSTLLPASIYAMTRNLAAVLFSSQVGHMVDRLPRLQVIRVSIGRFPGKCEQELGLTSSLVGQRCSVVLSCLLFYLLLSLESRASIPAWLLVGLLAFLSTVEKLSFVLNTISVERDWIVVIAGDSLDDLRSINSMMRRIDLASKLIAPLLIAFGHSFSPLAGIAIALWTALVSLPFEYLLIARVYRSCPALHHKHMGAAEPRSPSRTSDSAMLQPFTSASVDITYYCRHPAFLPSFSLSLLYLTVLSFGGQMISYLVSQGLPSWSIGLLRTAAAIFELSATWLAPHLMKSIGAVRSGIWLLNAQLSCLLLATLAVWFGTSPAILLAVFLPAVVASRAGLWGFDLSTQFLIQESVEAESRGRFSSIETAFQNVFELLAFATTVAFSDPAQFKIPCSISASATGLAAVVYAVYVRARRGHLFHASRCLDRKERAGSYQKVDQDEEDIST